MCSVIGAVIIVSGLYCVVWGKSKENSAMKGKSMELPVIDENALDKIPSDIKGNGTTASDKSSKVQKKVTSFNEEPWSPTSNSS